MNLYDIVCPGVAILYWMCLIMYSTRQLPFNVNVYVNGITIDLIGFCGMF